MTAPYIARTRRRRSGGAFATIATTSKTSGTTALAFTDIPSASETAASNSRRAKRKDTAHATKNATRMSLWPPPTTWYTTIGLHPIIAIANAARSGRTFCTSRPTTATVPRLASEARSWKLATTSVGFMIILVIRSTIQVDIGLHSDGIARHSGQGQGHSP